MANLNRLSAEVNEWNQPGFEHRARKNARVDRHKFGPCVEAWLREKARHTLHVLVVHRAENLVEIALFKVDRAPVCREEGRTEGGGDGERFEGQTCPNEGEEAEKVQWVTRDREWAFIDKVEVLAAGDVDRAPDTADASGDQKPIAEPRKQFVDVASLRPSVLSKASHRSDRAENKPRGNESNVHCS